MKKLNLLIIIICTLGFTVGCASISKEECEVGDWAAIGEKDGAKGVKSKKFYSYVKECKEFGITADKKAYDKGYNNGVKTFCTPSNGYDLGSKGRSNPNVCPKGMSAAFAAAHKKGMRIYDVKSQIKKKESKIESINDQIAKMQDEMVSGRLTGPQVAMKSIKVDKLRQEQKLVEKEKESLDKKLMQMESM